MSPPLKLPSPINKQVIFMAWPDSRPLMGRLLPGELARSKKFKSDTRREQFRRGRVLARRILKKLGATKTFEIKTAKRGNPIWPRNIVGAISHGAGWVCLACAKKDYFLSLGIDIESPTRTISPGFMCRVTTPTERSWLTKAGELTCPQSHLEIFSIKEAIYKALSPLVKKPISFQAVSIVRTKRGYIAKLAPSLQRILGKRRLRIVCLTKPTYILSWVGISQNKN